MRHTPHRLILSTLACLIIIGCSADDGTIALVDDPTPTTDVSSDPGTTEPTDAAATVDAGDPEPDPSEVDAAAGTEDATTSPTQDAGTVGPKPQDPTGRTGWACETDADCLQEPEHACLFGFCSERCKDSNGVNLPNTCNTVSANNAYGDTWGCPSDLYFCLPGNVAGKSVICTNPSHCPVIDEDLICSSAIWLGGTTIDGVCLPDIGGAGLGEPCETFSDCAAGLCVTGEAASGDGTMQRCSTHCTLNAHCGPGGICAGLGFDTQDAGTATAWAGICHYAEGSLDYCTCQDETTCSSGCSEGDYCEAFINTEAPLLTAYHWCVAEKADGAAVGDSCVNSVDCATRQCYWSANLNLGTSGYCSVACPGGDADCPTGMRCGKRSFHNQGTVDDRTDDPTYNTCVFGAEGDPCEVGAKDWCEDGLECVNTNPEWPANFGECTPLAPECTADSECGSLDPCLAAICDNGQCGTTPAEDGTSCGSGDDLCVESATCQAGECVTVEIDCDDSLSCTADSCDAGVCGSTLLTGTCLIDGVCYAEGDVHVDDACQTCDPSVATDAWTTTDGCVVSCDPACADGQECVDGACQDIVVACDPACVDGQECVDGACQDVVVACDPACADGQECVDGACQDIVVTYAVTFSVDMNCTDTAYTTVGLSGPSVGWCGDCMPLSDEDGDGIFTGTYDLPAGDFEYKYIVDGFVGQEDLISEMVGGASCAPVTDYFSYANRKVTIEGDMVLNETYSSCSACGSDPSGVTFTVDMNCSGLESFTTVYVTGPFAGWCGTCRPLNDDDGDGIWTATYPFEPGTVVEYLYQVDDWVDSENLVSQMVNGGTCAPVTDYNSYANRQVTVAEGPAQPTSDVYNSCFACDCAPTCDVSVECGADGCGGSCGVCADGSSCDQGVCVVDCVPSCAAENACGDDGCGGECGTCDGQTCVAGVCTADSGPIQPDDVANGPGAPATECNSATCAGLECCCSYCANPCTSFGSASDAEVECGACSAPDAGGTAACYPGADGFGEPPAVAGCMDSDATNYNEAASSDDGTCTYAVTFAIEAPVDCGQINVTGTFDSWSGWGAHADNDMTAAIESGAYEFVILCVDTTINEWYNDIWSASTIHRPTSECAANTGDDLNYGFTVEDAPMTVAYCAGSCDATCPVCQPTCASANGCGDDGCGGSCGTCDGGTTCTNGECVADCVPTCGTTICAPDGCGGVCGACDAATMTTEVSIQGYAYSPQDITVAVGTIVKWTNFDNAKHDVVSRLDSGGVDSNGPLQGPLLSKDQSWSFTFSDAGTYPYRCSPHPNMTASVTVE